MGSASRVITLEIRIPLSFMVHWPITLEFLLIKSFTHSFINHQKIIKSLMIFYCDGHCSKNQGYCTDKMDKVPSLIESPSQKDGDNEQIVE